MPPTLPISAQAIPSDSARVEALSWIAGGAFTFLLFLGLAHLEKPHAAPVIPELQDLRPIAMPLEAPPPPPRPTENVAAPLDIPPLTGIEIGASESPVRIAVMPVEFEQLVEPAKLPPRVVMPFNHLHTEFKPKIDATPDAQRIFRPQEVDQPPRAIDRVAPNVPPHLFGDARFLRVILIVLIETDGRISSTRVAQSSGQPEFDAIVARTMAENWTFSPAIRRGKKVRCLAQQPFRISLTGGSPYELP